MDHDALLDRVIALAEQALARGDHPFGALLAVDGVVVCEARNRVMTESDITAHAETVLVRKLEAMGALDQLATGVVYASCEPCPMCVGALFWAGARRGSFALSHERLNELAQQPGEDAIGFTISASEIGASARPQLVFTGPEREEEAAQAHVGFWTSRGNG